MDLRIDDTEYVEALHKEFNASDKTISLFGHIIESSEMKRDEVLDGIDILAKDIGLSYALIALFRQQVRCGFVVADPLLCQDNKEKAFHDPDTNITFSLQWNPIRELRHHHLQLIKKGILSNNVDQNKLINKNKNGKGCYLCKQNIDVQNPKEVLLATDLAGEKFFIGANFAFITNNHFTVMNARHLPQQYRKGVVVALNDFVDKTDGYFRAIFNGLAGASIKEHEHIQVTPIEFPVERIRVESSDIVFEENNVSVLWPKYYVPVLIVEGINKIETNLVSDSIINTWIKSDEEFHTINIISTKSLKSKLFRTFIILRDKRKLAGEGKRGAMAAFESGGNIVLSCRQKTDRKGNVDEKETFENANLGIIKQMLMDISPDEERCLCLVQSLTLKRNC